MSQNDFVIDNADGATVRADINSALQALASLSSGTTAPTTTYAGMLWWDTTNNLIKQRNGANDGWITLYGFDGTILDLLAGDTTPQLAGPLDPNSHYIGCGKGADIASASPLVIGTDGDYFSVTGTTNFAAMTVAANRRFTLEFAGVLTITHGSGITLPGAANYTTAAGDIFECQSTAANTIVVTGITKADGTAVVASAGGATTLIASASASSSSSINFANYLDSTYDHYILEFSDIVCSASAALWLRTTADGSTYDSGASDYGYHHDDVSSTKAGTASDTKMVIMTTNDPGTGYSASGIIHIFAPSSINAYKLFMSDTIEYDSVSAIDRRQVNGGVRKSTSAIVGVQILPSSGNITSGNFYLYGVKKS